MPSLSVLEYLDKFGKTVAVVEWIVDLNNSLLASETSLFQTAREMTDGSRLLSSSTRNGNVRTQRAPPCQAAKTDQAVPCLQ